MLILCVIPDKLLITFLLAAITTIILSYKKMGIPFARRYCGVYHSRHLVQSSGAIWSKANMFAFWASSPLQQVV
jgi:hypothetical protein